MVSDTLKQLETRVLGQLLLMQNVVITLPDENAIFSFICEGLLDVPGVKKAIFIQGNEVPETLPDKVNFPLKVGESYYGCISLILSDIEKFRPYRDYLSNLMFMIGVILEERYQREIIAKHEQQLEKEVKKRTEQLNNEKKLLQSIVDTVPVMITIYDSEVNSIILNKATEHITGWNNEDAERYNVMELAYPDPEYRNKVIEFMKEPKPEFRDLIMRTKDGRDIETSWANVNIPDCRSVGVGVDISERKKMEKELLNYRNHLQYLVNRRTKELEDKNKELQEYNDLFVGREFRIKELKDTILELKAKLNQSS